MRCGDESSEAARYARGGQREGRCTCLVREHAWSSGGGAALGGGGSQASTHTCSNLCGVLRRKCASSVARFPPINILIPHTVTSAVHFFLLQLPQHSPVAGGVAEATLVRRPSTQAVRKDPLVARITLDTRPVLSGGKRAHLANSSFARPAVSNVGTHVRGLPRRRRSAPAVRRRRGGGTGRWRLPRRAVGSAVCHPRGEWRDRRALVHLALQCSVESKPDRAWLAWPKSLSAAEAGRTQTALRSGQPRPISRLGCAWHPGHIGPCLRHRRCAPESIGELTSAFFFYACTHGGPLGDIGSFAHMTHPTHTTRQEEIAEWLARPAALTRPLTTTLTPLVRALLL